MKYILSFLFILSSYGLLAQEENEFKTIFGGREAGGYGSFAFGGTVLDTTPAFVFSARGGIILGHSFSMGLGGSGFVTEYQYDRKLNLNASLAGGYGGAYFEVILAGNSPVHVSIPCLFGIGGAAYSTWVNEGTDYERINYVQDVSTFLVVEPGVELEFNLTRFFRIAGFLSYRYTTDIDISAPNESGGTIKLVNPKALNAYSAGVIFKFGKF